MLDTIGMDSHKATAAKKRTYHITYGIAIIILTLVLNDMALFMITGRSIVPITFNIPVSNAPDAGMTFTSEIPVVTKTATTTASTTPKKSLPK